MDHADAVVDVAAVEEANVFICDYYILFAD
jgi:hypothetical protein